MMNISDSNDNLSAAVPKRLLMEARTALRIKSESCRSVFRLYTAETSHRPLSFRAAGKEAKHS